MKEFNDVIALNKKVGVKYYTGSIDIEDLSGSLMDIPKRNDNGYLLKILDKTEDYIKLSFSCLKSSMVDEYEEELDINVEREHKKALYANIVIFDGFIAFYDSDEPAIKEFLNYSLENITELEPIKINEDNFSVIKNMMITIEEVKVDKISDAYIKKIAINGKSTDFDKYQNVIDFKEYETVQITGVIEEENCNRKIKVDKNGKITFGKTDKEFTLQNIRHGYRILTSGENND